MSCALAIRTNLLVWLKADEGVEMDDPIECRATGAGTSCDVKAYVASSLLLFETAASAHSLHYARLALTLARV